MRRMGAVTILPLALTACLGAGGRPEAAPPAVVDAPRTEDVIRALKADLRDYLIYQQSVEAEPARDNACRGQLAFKVSSIDVKLVTTTERSVSGGVGSKVPLAGLEFGPSAGGSSGVGSSQDVSFSLQLRPGIRLPGPVTQPRPGTFYAALRATREAMLEASDVEPCLTFGEKQDNSITAAFEAKREGATGLEVGFLIFSVEASAKRGRTVGNTVTVRFDAEGGTLLDAAGRRVRARGFLTQRGAKVPVEAVLEFEDGKAVAEPAPQSEPARPRSRP